MALPILGTILAEIWPMNRKEVEENFFKTYGPVYGTFVSSQPVFNTG